MVLHDDPNYLHVVESAVWASSCQGAHQKKKRTSQMRPIYL